MWLQFESNKKIIEFDVEPSFYYFRINLITK